MRENREHIQDVDSVFPGAVGVRVSRLHYFWSHPRKKKYAEILETLVEGTKHMDEDD